MYGTRPGVARSDAPVLACARGIGGQVAHERGVDAARRVEADGRLDSIVVQVAIDGRRDADDARRHASGFKVLGEEGRVRVGDRAADQDEAVEVELCARRLGLREMFGRSDHVRRAAEEMHAARVEVRCDVRRPQLPRVAPEESDGPVDEAPELGTGPAARGEEVREAGDQVVSAGALASAEDDADGQVCRDGEWLALGGATGDDLDPRALARLWQRRADEERVGRGWGHLAAHDAQPCRALKELGQLGRGRRALLHQAHRLGRGSLLEQQRARHRIRTRPRVLDRPGADERLGKSPSRPLRLDRGKRRAAQLDERLTDHRLVLALATLDGHHARERHPLGRPGAGGLGEPLRPSHPRGTGKGERSRAGGRGVEKALPRDGSEEGDAKGGRVACAREARREGGTRAPGGTPSFPCSPR